MRLTKSLFVEYLDFPKLARWKLNNPDTYKKIRKTETEEAEQHIINIGQVVESTIKQKLEQEYGTDALDLMPHYFLLKDEEDEEDEIPIKAIPDLPKAEGDTLNAMRNQEKILYQPTFVYGDCVVRADFMIWSGSTYDLLEAKAKTYIRKGVTDDGEKKRIGAIEKDFIHDVSFQKYVINKVLKQNNLPALGDIYFIYLNGEYLKEGPLDLSRLVLKDQAGIERELEVIQRKKPKMLKISDSLLDTKTIEAKLEEMRTTLILPEPEFNKRFPRPGNKYLEYFGEEKPFGTVMGMGIKAKAELIQELYETEKIQLTDLSTDEIEQFSEKTQEFIQLYLQNKKTKTPIIDHVRLAEVVDTFQFPLCFYDYESVSVPIPFMDKTRPYMQTIVQYSLHKYYEDGSMKHYGGLLIGEGEKSKKQLQIANNPNAVAFESEHLITGSYKDLLEQMLEDIGEDINHSTFLVRHEGFENTRNKEIAELYPDLADAFLKINEQTYDLKKIVSEKIYYDNKFEGSASIKKVLPVLAPEMSYEDLEIGRGDLASRMLHKLIIGEIPEKEQEELIKHLLLYCGQDTLAMVKVYEKMLEG